jgi:hypothetical protein
VSIKGDIRLHVRTQKRLCKADFDLIAASKQVLQMSKGFFLQSSAEVCGCIPKSFERPVSHQPLTGYSVLIAADATLLMRRAFGAPFSLSLRITILYALGAFAAG